MATIHRTTMEPTKLELIADWLPRQAWYADSGRPPALTRAGGFRLDDPAGEVGLEFVLVADGAAGADTTYFVPLTYRGAPLAAAEEGLLGTSEHGVLGRRWIYDGAHDPVAVTQLLEFLRGGTEAQHQSRSDTPDPSVGRSWSSAARLVVPDRLRVSQAEPGRTTIAVESTDDSSSDREERAVDLVRALQPGPAADAAGAAPTGLGHVDVEWTRPDGTTSRGIVVVVR